MKQIQGNFLGTKVEEGQREDREKQKRGDDLKRIKKPDESASRKFYFLNFSSLKGN